MLFVAGLLSACALIASPSHAAAFSSMPQGPRVPNGRPGSSYRSHSMVTSRSTCIQLATPANNIVELETMRASQIKAELRVRRIAFADCFDKESLVEKLRSARDGRISPAPSPARTRAPPSAPPASPVADGDPETMRASQIKAELRVRRIAFADCFDKESLVEKLRSARDGRISPPPPPRGAARRGDFEFGAECRQGEDGASMEDAFKAAGWTGQEARKSPSKVDEARSPGLNRNFAEVDRNDFLKSYSPGSRRRR